MSTLVPVALVLAAVVVTLVLVLRLRARRAVSQSPRTVADLVRMRDEAAAAAAPVELPVPAAKAAEPVIAGPVIAEPAAAEDGAAEPVDDEPAEVAVADEPEIGRPAEVASPPAVMPAADLATAQSPALRDPDDAVVDTPWGRAARMAADGGALWSPDITAVPEPAPVIPVEEPRPLVVDESPAEAEPPEAVPAEAELAETELLEAEPAEVAPRSRPRRTPAEMAAEQAAADLALLRTFGFADSSGRLDTEPVVSLTAAHPDDAVQEAGAEQRIAFRVVGRDGSGIPGASVTLLDDHGRESAAAVAGADGRGELKAPHPGSFVLVSTAADRQPGAVAITVADAATEADVLLARSASLSGTVYGEEGPVVGARLTLVQDGEVVDAVESGADGAYRIVDLAAGEYGLSVSAVDCEPVAVLLDVPDETLLRHDIDLEPAGVPAPQRADGVDDLMIGHGR